MEPDDFGEVIGALLAAFTGARAAAVDELAEAHTRKTARLMAATARLRDEAGDDDPEVVELLSRVGASDDLRVGLNERALWDSRRREPDSGEWLAYGQLLTAEGKPAAGYRIRLVDPRRRKIRLGETEVDEYGDWSISFPECPPADDEESKVFLEITDAKGAKVYSSEDSFTLGPHPVEFLEITLPERKRRRSPKT